MNDNNDSFYIKNCIQMIENQLNWGPNQNWSNYDFEQLSAAIESKTKVVLSVTTLKRIWGKVKYPHSPTMTTLNTLAQYLNYTDWRDFKQNNISATTVEIENDQPETEISIPQNKEKKKRFRSSWKMIAGLICALLASLFALKYATNSPKIDTNVFKFEANKMVSDGVPNSVVFTYDASKATTDSIYIVQTWDTRRRTLVPKSQHHHSAIYYYPGFFRAKLMVDSTIVKTHDLQITTNGWLCLAENGPIPLYFQKEDYEKNNCIEINTRTLEKYNLPLFPIAPKIRFFNQRDLGDLMNDNFTFETTLKNDFNLGSNTCQYVEVLIQCKDDIIIVPLVSPACVGDMELYAAGALVDSKHADLSKFGCNLTEWTHLKVVAQNKLMTFSVNGVVAYTLTFPHAPTGVVGVQIRFNGVGAVKETKFGDGKSSMYSL